MASVAAACDRASPVDAGQRVRGRLRFALGAAQPSPSVSDIDQVRLFVGPAGGAPTQSFGTGLGRGPLEVRFDVTVPTGATRFRVEARSNLDTLLFDGESTVQVERDGFEAVVQLVARRPVLLATRDTTLLVRAVTAGAVVFLGSFTVANPGAGALAWRVEPQLSTALTACDGPCVLVSPSSGTVPAGGVVTVSVTGVRQLPATPLGLRLSAPQGFVDLVLRVAP